MNFLISNLFSPRFTGCLKAKGDYLAPTRKKDLLGSVRTILRTIEIGTADKCSLLTGHDIYQQNENPKSKMNFHFVLPFRLAPAPPTSRQTRKTPFPREALVLEKEKERRRKLFRRILTLQARGIRLLMMAFAHQQRPLGRVFL
jgi:hypothetical protein